MIGDTILQLGIHKADRISGTSTKTAPKKRKTPSVVCLLSGRSDVKNDHRKRVNQPIKNAEEDGVSQLGLHCFEILQARNGPTLQGERWLNGVESGKVELVATATAGNQHEPCSSHVDVQCEPCERHNPCNEPHDVVLLCRVRRDWAGLRTVAEKRECQKYHV